MKLYPILICLCISFNLQSQFEVFKRNTISHVEIDGLEDMHTIEFLKKALKDSSVILIIDDLGDFTINSLVNKFYEFIDNEVPACFKNIEFLRSFIDMNRVIGFNYNRKHKLPSFFLKKKNAFLYEGLVNKYNIDNNKKHLNISDSTLLHSFCADVVELYQFNKLDSLVLFRSAFNQKLQISDFESIGITDRKIIYIHFNYTDYIYYKDNIGLNGDNIYLFVSSKGSANNHIGFLKFRNRIKKAKTLNNFDFVPFESLPKKIHVTRELILEKAKLQNVKFLYLKELQNCLL